MKKLYVGNIPNGDHWELDYELQDYDGESWFVYVGHTCDQWTNLKLVAIDPVPIKANYWFAWNGERFSQSTDYLLLKQHRPKLCEALRRIAVKYLYDA